MRKSITRVKLKLFGPVAVPVFWTQACRRLTFYLPLIALMMSAVLGLMAKDKSRSHLQRAPDIRGVWICPNPFRQDFWKDDRGNYVAGGWKIADIFDDQKLSQWETVRGHIRGIKYFLTPFGLRGDENPPDFSDAIVEKIIAKHQEWNLGLGIESGWATGSGRDSIYYEEPALRKIKDFGGKVDYVAVEEWLSKCFAAGFGTQECPVQSLDQLAQEAAVYFYWIKQLFPDAYCATIETIPLPETGFDLNTVKTWILKLKAACAQKGVRLAYVECDNMAVPAQLPKYFPMSSLLEFEGWVRGEGLGWSAICMSEEGLLGSDGKGAGRFPGRVPRSDKDWSVTLLHSLGKYIRAGGRPDIFMIESWHAVPRRGLPESKNHTFMNTTRKAIEETRKISR